jgi:hypothetical protein
MKTERVKTKLVQIGDSYGIVFDGALLGKVEFQPETDLEVTIVDGCLVISKVGARRPRLASRFEDDHAWPGRPKPTPERPEPKLGFPKKQPW